MNKPHNNPDFDRDPLEALATEFAERCRAGAAPAIEDYARRHPELAADIRDLFPTILAVEMTKGLTTLSLSGGGSASSPPLERLGDFRIVRELGRGGMGVVYEAVQESLDRRVAIKVLPPEFARDAVRKERFDREARTAARLHHTNIVPIFGVGEQDGRPYFVMQYIAGTGLDEIFRNLVQQRTEASGKGRGPGSDPFTTSDSVVRAARCAIGEEAENPVGQPGFNCNDVPTVYGGQRLGAALGSTRRDPPVGSRPGSYWSAVASLMAQAADALHFAHSQGVLHRDVKPSNLLVDADGILSVTDFGLAKAMEHDELTQAGDVVGTLRYLAPEQFEGRADARSDIYSLGVTAFELATLTPAFAAANRSQLIHAIVHGGPLRARERCPAVPADLETILLKATARAPNERYRTAAEFRDDLQRFASDLPILARRSTAWERGRRWARRNRALALTTAGVFLLLLVTAIVSTEALWSVRRANERTREALLGETEQRERAEATSQLAVDALDTVLNELAPDEFQTARDFSLDGTDANTIPVALPTVVTPQTASLLGHLLAFYERLAAHHGESAPLKLKAGAANRRVGEIYELLGRHVDADTAYRAAAAIYDGLLPREAEAGDGPADADQLYLAVLLARTWNQLGGLLAAQDRMPEAQAEFDSAAQLLEPLVERQGAPAEARFELARTYYLAARRSALRLPPDPLEPGGERRPPPGRGPENRPEAGEGPRPRGPGMGGPPGPMRRRARLGPGPEGERRRAHIAQLESAISLLDELTAESPEESKYLHLSALCLREREALRRGPGRPPDVTEIVRLLEELMRENPSIARYRFDLAETLVMRDRGLDAAEHVSRALTILQSLSEERPDVPAYRFALGHAHLRLSHVHEAAGLSEPAMEQARLALAIQMQLASDHPDTFAFAMTASLCESVVARLLQQAGDLEQAKDMLITATGRLVKLDVEQHPRPDIRAFAGRCFDQLSRVYHALGDEARAREALEAARSLAPGPPRP